MNLTEKIAYIKGLAEGLQLDGTKAEVKIINVIVDALDDIAAAVSETENLFDELSAQVDEIDHDLAEMETEYYDDECDCCDDEDLDDDPFYEVSCASCGQKLQVSEDILLEGEIECPNCGEVLEFDFSDIFAEDECGCRCCSDGGEDEAEADKE